MPSLEVSNGKNKRSLAVDDISHAVRFMAREMRKYSSDKSVLASLQLWSDNGFKNKLRLKYQEDWLTFEYRN